MSLTKNEGTLKSHVLVKLLLLAEKVSVYMERNRSEIAGGGSVQRTRDEGERNVRESALEWWYRHFAPSGSTAAASLAQREKVRRGRTASIVMLIFMLFLLAILLLAVLEQDYPQAIAAGLGIPGSMLALLLNRKGWVKVAGLLVLVIVYVGEIISLVVGGGLTATNTFLLDFTVVPDVVVLAFFSANSLFPIVWLNVVLIWGLVMFGPHDATIAALLYREPLQIFAHAYILQLIIASTLYLWARSTELALQRADRAEEIVVLEKRENERKQLELEQKNQLDSGIQQILQTHVAVANGDLNARAPLNQDHVLWQVAMSLNNLIARMQSMSHTESELRQQIWEGNERGADHHNSLYGEAGRVTDAQKALLPEAGRVTGAQKALLPESGRVTGAQRALPPEVGRKTGAQKALPSEAGRVTGAQRALPPDAGRMKKAQKAQNSESGAVRTRRSQRAKSDITDQQPAGKREGASRPETGGTGGRLRALRLEQDDSAPQEKITRPVRSDITGEQEAVHPELGNARDAVKKYSSEKTD
jgi:hypothetical protein